MHRVYLDNNATTPLLPEVFEAMRPYFFEKFGNASSIHQQGQQARSAVEHAREQVAELLNCRPAELVFTSGGTEGDNLALFGLMKPGDHIITSAVEHHAVLNACKRLEDMGCAVTYLPVDGRALGDPDEVQAAGKVSLDVKEIGCDLLTITGHKMHGPQGAGALFVRRGTLLQPMMYRGRHERSRRAGTENLPGIVGLGNAAEIAREGFADGSVERMAGLRERLEREIVETVEQIGVNSVTAPRVPNTTNIYFDCIEGEAMVIALDLKGLSVSTGAACSSGAIEPSHVLTAMGLSPDCARASIRFSLGKQNTADDVEFALSLVPEVVARLREISPVYKGAHA